MSTPVSTRSGSSGAAWMPSVLVTLLKSFGPVSRSQVDSFPAARGASAALAGRGGASASAAANEDASRNVRIGAGAIQEWRIESRSRVESQKCNFVKFRHKIPRTG